jgi:CPA2 family monovalent cation:H+ antiporter-2
MIDTHPIAFFVRDLVMIFGLSLVVVLLFHRLRLPSIVGFLIAGALVGPSGLNLVDDPARVELLAEVGVVLLLFTIGLEFSLARLSRIRIFILGGGGLQVGLTIAVTALVAVVFFGLALREAVFWGFLIALSSTAIVLKLLLERGELDAPHGRLALAILIFQDLIVVPMMMGLPFLAGDAGRGPLHVALTLGRSLLLVALILLAARWLVPKALAVVVRARSRELFVITVLLICAGIAWLSEAQGLSLALGAFIAGLVISESEYSHQALADVMPFRDSFISLFFVSIGMLLDVRAVAGSLPVVLLIAAGVLLLKAAAAGGATLALGYPLRIAALVGLTLPQVGEFSFVLAQAGQGLGLLSADGYQLFLSISILTMLVTPLLIQVAPHLLANAGSTRLTPAWLAPPADLGEEPPPRDHVIIVGYGLNGRNLARVLRDANIPYVIIDLHTDAIRHGRAQGEPIRYGDATQGEVLQQAGIGAARLLVLALSDPFATRRAIQVARQANPDIHIVVRTRYVREVEELLRLGADEVVPEEFETSLEIFELALREYEVPPREIKRKQEEIRREGYAWLRRETAERYLGHTELPLEVEVHHHPLRADAPAVGQRLADLQLPEMAGVLVAAVIRNGETHPTPAGAFQLKAEDTLVLTGTRDEIDRAIYFLDDNRPEAS